MGPSSAPNVPLGFDHTPQAQAEPGEMGGQQTRMAEPAHCM
jgi:hypothetical protein